MNLVEGNNSWVKVNKDNTLTISTPKVDDADAAPLQTFFPERDYISLLEVLSTVNRCSGFLDEFQHSQQRYHRGHRHSSITSFPSPVVDDKAFLRLN